MHRRHIHILRTLAASLALAAPIVVAGCGEGPPPVSTSTTEATVRGKVVVRGKPVSKGNVVFDPANYRRKDVTQRTAAVDKDGNYTITTLVGENSVRFEGPATARIRELDGLVQGFDVKEGENLFDINLP